MSSLGCFAQRLLNRVPVTRVLVPAPRTAFRPEGGAGGRRRPVTHLSSFLVQLRQLLLVPDPHLSHLLLQSISLTRVSAHAGRFKQSVNVEHQTAADIWSSQDVGSPALVPPLELIFVRLVPLRQNSLQVRLLQEAVI